MLEPRTDDTENQQLLLWSSLVELSHVASTAENFNQVYESLASTLRRFISFDRLAVRLIDQDSGTVANVFVYGAEISGWQAGETHELDHTVTARLLESRDSIIFDDYERDLLLLDPQAVPVGTNEFPSLLAVPLISRGRVLGAIYLRSRMKGAFTKHDASIVESFATHIAPTIENSLHVEGLAAEAGQRKVMLELGRIITSSLDIESVFERFSELVSQLIPSERITVTTLTPDGLAFRARFTSGFEIPSLAPGYTMSLEGTLVKAALEKGGPVTVHFTDPVSAEAALNTYPALKSVISAGMCSFLSTPMVAGGRVIGTFHVQTRKPLAYSANHDEVIQQVAAFAASAIAKSDLMQRIERESTERQVLAEIGRIISSTLDFGDVFERVTDEVRKLLPADRLVITTVDDKAETITDRYISGIEIPVWDSQRNRQLKDLPTETVVKERQAAITFSEQQLGGRVRMEGLEESRNVGLHSTMFAPLISGDRVIGTISVKSSKQRAYTETHLEVLKAIALQIAGAVAASDLYLETLRLADERERRLEAESENRELQRINQAKSEFLSTVSHELKTPLTSILAFTGLLRRKRDSDLTDRERKHLEVIKRNGERLDRLISDLVDVSRLEANTIKLTPSRFDLDETLHLLLESFEPVVAAKSQSIILTCPDREISLYADVDRVTQVISNLISNASKYSNAGSEIAIEVTLTDDSAVISVRDQGIGISAEDQGQLFTAFFRADNALTKAQPGTGLGLVIAKSIAQMHSGDLTVESEPDGGSTFTFTVPFEYRGE